MTSVVSPIGSALITSSARRMIKSFTYLIENSAVVEYSTITALFRLYLSPAFGKILKKQRINIIL